MNEMPTANNSNSRKTLVFLWEVVKVVAISLAIILPVRYFLIKPFYVKGASMEPNFHNHEYLIIDELSYRFSDPDRGDVVVLRNPNQSSQFFIKRIIGLPGEHVEIRNRKVFIDGEKLDETLYLDASLETWGSIDVTLTDSDDNGEDEYFLMGDNRNESLDSRRFGPISKDEFVGRTWIRAWPFDRAQIFDELHYEIDSDTDSN